MEHEPGSLEVSAATRMDAANIKFKNFGFLLKFLSVDAVFGPITGIGALPSTESALRAKQPSRLSASVSSARSPRLRRRGFRGRLSASCGHERVKTGSNGVFAALRRAFGRILKMRGPRTTAVRERGRLFSTQNRHPSREIGRPKPDRRSVEERKSGLDPLTSRAA